MTRYVLKNHTWEGRLGGKWRVARVNEAAGTLDDAIFDWQHAEGDDVELHSGSDTQPEWFKVTIANLPPGKYAVDWEGSWAFWFKYTIHRGFFVVD